VGRYDNDHTCKASSRPQPQLDRPLDKLDDRIGDVTVVTATSRIVQAE
jgi:hypothetical protein